MTTQYTPILKLALPVQGELSGTWGDVVNDNITSMIEQAIAGRLVINTWSGNSHTLTIANGTTAEARAAMLSLTDSNTQLGAAGTVVCPALSKTYIVKNGAGQIITVKTASGSGIAIPNGKTMLVYCDGTNVLEGVDHVVTLSAGTLTITGLTTFASLKGADATTVTGILDEDNMASNSATKLVTQQSVKAYVDAQVGSFDTLAEVLAGGNTTGSNDIDVDAAQKVQFRDAAIYINSSADGQLDIVADTEIQIAAATVDLNGNLDVSGTALVTGTLDVDGATQLDSTLTVGVNDTGHDVKFFGASSGSYMLWDESADDLILGGAAGLTIAGDLDVDGAATFTTEITANGGIALGDNDKATFGASDDLQIFHDGSNSYVQDAGTGDLIVRANNLALQATSGEQYAAFVANGSASLFYDNAQKLATTATGIDVTGTATMDGLTVDGATLLDNGVNATHLTLTGTTGRGLEISTATNSFTDNTAVLNAKHSQGILSFKTASTERMRIDSSGRVGIGTSSPQALIDISSATTSTLRLSNSDTTLTENQITGQLEFYQGDTSSQGTGITGKIAMRSVPLTGGGYFGNAADMDFYVSGDSNGYASNNATLKAITIQGGSGRVGIGISSPTVPLTVNNQSDHSDVAIFHAGGGTPNRGLKISTFANTNSNAGVEFDAQNSTGAFKFSTGGTERMRIDSSGNVGIGCTPNTKLQIQGDGVTLKLDGTANTSRQINLRNTGTAEGQIQTDGNMHFIQEDANRYMRFSTANTERMRIDSAGNVDLYQGSNLTWRYAAGSTIRGSISTDSADNITFSNTSGNTERMRIDSSGNVLVGTTDASPWSNSASNATDNGVVATSGGIISSARYNGATALFNRTGDDGAIISVRKQGQEIGSISSYAGTYLFIGSSGNSTDTYLGFYNGTVRPVNASGTNRDNVIDLGTSSARFDDIYATNGTIQTSDRNEKQDIAELSDAEQRVAVACKGLLRKFRWKDSVAEKGDDARTHFGIIAQDLQAAFEAEGLDAGDYAMFISTTWTDEETNEEKTRMGVRYSELLAFIISAI